MGSSGNQQIMFTVGGLDTTITSMGNRIYNADTSEDWRLYGYDGGADYFTGASMGTIGEDTFIDGSSIERTVTALYYGEPGGGGAEDDDLFLCLSDQSMDNDDGDFVSLDYNGQNYLRSAATFTGTTGSCSTWRWLNINPNGPTSGNPAVVINI